MHTKFWPVFQVNKIEFYWTFILVLTCFFGVFSNLVNLIVFIRLNPENPMYKYMICSSFANIVYLAISSIVLIFNESNSSFKIEKSFLHALYYVSIVFEMLNILIEILISWQRYLMILNRNFLSKTEFKAVILALFVLKDEK